MYNMIKYTKKNTHTKILMTRYTDWNLKIKTERCIVKKKKQFSKIVK